MSSIFTELLILVQEKSILNSLQRLVEYVNRWWELRQDSKQTFCNNYQTVASLLAVYVAVTRFGQQACLQILCLIVLAEFVVKAVADIVIATLVFTNINHVLVADKKLRPFWKSIIATIVVGLYFVIQVSFLVLFTILVGVDLRKLKTNSLDLHNDKLD